MNTYTIPQAASAYGVSEKTLYRLIKSHKLNVIKSGKQFHSKYTIRQDVLDKCLGHSVISENEIPKDADRKTKGKRGTEQGGGKATPQDALGHTEGTSEVLQVLQDAIEILKKQLAEKDKQLERLDKKLDQQQQLTAGIQKQLLLQAPTHEVTKEGKAGQNQAAKVGSTRKKKAKTVSRRRKTQIPRSPQKEKKSFWSRLFGT